MSFKSLFSALFLTGCFLLTGSLAFAGMESSVLFVAPHRVVIKSDEKVEVVNVANKSDKTHRYDLTLIDQVMNDQGQTLRQDTFEYSVKRMVRFVPKRFTLKPGERQVVRIMVKRPADLADGDYHSHLLFREVPLSVEDKKDLKDEREDSGEKKATFEIRALYGIAVPIIVQQGKLESDIALNDVKIVPASDKAPQSVSIDLTRSGNAEAAVQVAVKYVKPTGGDPVELTSPVWVRMYREVERVTKTIEMKDLPEGVKLAGGKLVVSLTKQAGTAGSESSTSTREFQLP